VMVAKRKREYGLISDSYKLRIQPSYFSDDCFEFYFFDKRNGLSWFTSSFSKSQGIRIAKGILKMCRDTSNTFECTR